MDLPSNMAIDPARIPTRAHRSHPSLPWLSLPVHAGGHRLSGADYRHPECICLVTTCTRDRVPAFSRPEAARLAQAVLLEQARQVRYSLFAYAIMPDHVHLVMSPGQSGLSISEIVGRWKSFLVYRARAQVMTGWTWQKGFYDRILRSDERAPGGFECMIAYVLENPVRKGLAKRWQEYPYCACTINVQE